MATQNDEDARFQEILQLEGINLEEFFQQAPNQNLFINAQTYPQFFDGNLVSPNRVLKEFLNNPQSNIRILYFQLLRLGYEIQSETNNNRDFIVNLRRIVFHPDFQILFTQQTEDKRNLYNDFQFKRLFAEFIVLLERQQFPNVEEIICHYSIIDTVFIHIFRSLLASQNINEQFDVAIPSEIVFTELCNLLLLTITSYGNCWKFQDSDMFCYEDGENKLYLAYIVDDGTSESQDQIQQQQAIDNRQIVQNQNIHPDAITTASNIIPPPKTFQNPSFGIPTQTHHNQTTINRLYGNLTQNKSIELQNNSSFNYNANDYFNKKQELNRSESKQFTSSYKGPQHRSDFRSQYKPYQSPFTTSYNNNFYDNHRNSNNYNSYDNNTHVYQTNNYVPTFKPVEPTPIPSFENYRSSVQSNKQYFKPYRYNDTYNDHKTTQPESYTSSVFASSYKPVYIPSGGDYSSDFTPPDILSKLRPDNRDNIAKIRQSMQGISKGGQIPPNFDLRKSAAYNNSSVSPYISKQDLYRNESHRQFQYQTSNNSSYKSFSTNNQFNPLQYNFQQSYSSFYN